MTQTLDELRRTFNRWSRHEGNHDFLHPSETQARYMFHLRDDAPQGLRGSYVLSLDYDEERDPEESPLDVALWLKTVYDRYWYTSYKTDIANLIAYLESVKDSDYHNLVRFKVAQAEREIEKWTKVAHEWRQELAVLQTEG